MAVMVSPGSDVRSFRMRKPRGGNLGWVPPIEQQVGARQQDTNFLHAGCLIEIGDDAALVGIQPGKGCALAASAPGLYQRRQASSRIAARRLDLEDLGGEIRKQFSAITQRIAAADLDDAQLRQR